ILNIELDEGILKENSCLEITFFDAISSRYSNQKTVKRYEITKQRTQIKLTLPEPMLYARILFLPGGALKAIHDSPVSLSVNNGVFILEEGDSVNFHLHHRKANIANTVEFSGKDAAKYRTIFELNNTLP